MSGGWGGAGGEGPWVWIPANVATSLGAAGLEDDVWAIWPCVADPCTNPGDLEVTGGPGRLATVDNGAPDTGPGGTPNLVIQTADGEVFVTATLGALAHEITGLLRDPLPATVACVPPV